MLPCWHVNRSAKMYRSVARTPINHIGGKQELLAARSGGKGVTCKAHLTYFRLPSIAMPPSLVNLIANFVHSWTWSLFPFSARPVHCEEYY